MARWLAVLMWGAFFCSHLLSMKIAESDVPACKGSLSSHGHTSCNENVGPNCANTYTILEDGTYVQCGTASDVNCLVVGPTCVPRKASWQLALNLNPSDGHNFGYGGPWAEDVAVGTVAAALERDFKDKDVMKKQVKYLAIARHSSKQCDAVKVWELANDKSLLERFQDHNPGRQTASKGGPVFEYMKPGMAGSTVDPIFATKGRLMLNWWYANNGARMALEDGAHFEGLLPDVSAIDDNDDAVHGLGNEFAADTKNGEGGDWNWHDAAEKMTRHCVGSHNCKIIGKDHGKSLKSGNFYGQYAVYVSSGTATSFPCEGATLKAEMKL